MTDSLILKSPTAFTGGARAPQKPDPLARPGTRMLIDFTDPRCHPTGEIVPGALVGGQTFKCLAGSTTAMKQGRVAGSAGAATPWTVNADGSLTSTGATSAAIKFGYLEGFNIGGSTDEWLMFLHARLNSGFLTTNYKPLMYNGSNANSSPLYMDWGVGGNLPRSGAGDGSAAWVGTVPTAIAVGEIFQLACMVHAGSSPGRTSYKNGVFITSSASGPASIPATSAGQPLQIFGEQACTIYRAGVINLTEAKAAEAEYWDTADILEAQPTALLDYQFVNNLLSAAPRTPFA